MVWNRTDSLLYKLIWMWKIYFHSLFYETLSLDTLPLFSLLYFSFEVRIWIYKYVSGHDMCTCMCALVVVDLRVRHSYFHTKPCDFTDWGLQRTRDTLGPFSKWRSQVGQVLRFRILDARAMGKLCKPGK